MMKVVTAGEMAALDRQATEKYGVPSLTLMENAGKSVARGAASLVGDVRGRRISIFCGKGNNGGDGLAAGRHLLEMGARPRVFLLASFQDLRGDARANLDMATMAGVGVQALTAGVDRELLGREVHGSALIVDALLGTGFTPPVRGLYAEVVSFINTSGIPVLAVDMPSGLPSDGGPPSGPSVKAAATVTFGLPKPGHFLHPAAARCGKLLLADIGFPSALIDETPAAHFLLTPAFAASRIAPREPDSHKGDYGHLLLVAGSRGYAGASLLAARGALRAGAGLVTVALPQSQAPPSLDSLPEAMLLPLPETDSGTTDEGALEMLLEHLPGKGVLALGPGLSRNSSTVRLVRRLLPEVPVPMVIDADGLNALEGSLSVLMKCRAETVITPHPGELGRLLGLTSSEVREKRVDLAREFSKKYGVIVVLKGANTVVAAPTGAIHINTTGNPGMAAGGTGDVLTGMIASFICQGHAALEAALLGVHLHGRAAEIAAAGRGPWGYLASEVADAVPAALREALDRGPDEDTSAGTLRVLVP